MVEPPPRDTPDRTPGRPPASGVGTATRTGRQATGSGYSTWTEEGFSGWAWFAGGLMVLVGLFQVMAGITALASADYYTIPTRDLVVDASYSTWGWVHLVLGLVMVVTGGGLALGNAAARVVGVALAGLSALVNLLFLTASPFAGALIIALDVFVIYAITVHGNESRQSR
ncbi:Integral membrane protein of unknown function (modular protein) [Modestobacter italicus]|uniref:DUF7144 domain-containing protein n=1 Tax=Modestobacter italicus (strain DSM 44449 / CECT 9708 / BC 501) TaxID=2732864 RepID=I4F061_MODI5|nr:hypothetical protein [Modestobacter marinus]CCH89024.1 Integral membrane protein of unknown function (modular protein) [Modestobacter marinus]